MEKQQAFISSTIHARRAELGLNQDVRDLGGPSRSVMGDAERLGVLPSSVGPRAKLAKVFRWKPDACDRLERGELPETDAGLTHDEIRQVIQTMRYALAVLESRLEG